MSVETNLHGSSGDSHFLCYWYIVRLTHNGDWTNIVLLDMGTEDTGPGDALTYKSVAAGMIVPPNISDPAAGLCNVVMLDPHQQH